MGRGRSLAAGEPELDDAAENVENLSAGVGCAGRPCQPGRDRPGWTCGELGSVVVPGTEVINNSFAGDLVVLSVWQGDSCVGTFRMPVEDVPRLSGLLAAAVGDRVGDPSQGREPGPRPEADPGTSTDPGR